MAYTLVSGYVRPTRTSAQWTQTDLSQVPLNQLMFDYADVYLVLQNTITQNNEYLLQAALQTVLPTTLPMPTVTAWLASLSNKTLPTQTSAPVMTTKSVGYSDAWQAGYVVMRSDANRSPQSQVIPSGKPDLLLTKNGIDLYAMAQYLLVTVNGFLHQTSGSVNGLYVLGGGVSGLLANCNHVGVLSFLNVAAIQQIPITANMLYKPSPTLLYRQSVYLQSPVSLTGKTVLLSIGGYLHVLDNTYDIVGDRDIKINMRYVPLPERYFQSLKRIDLSALPLEAGPGNSGQFSVDSIYSDAVIQAYLTLSQSFIIVVDTPTFYKQTFQLERPGYPGRYFNHQGQRLPMIGSHGRLYDYRLSQEMDTFVYGCEPAYDDHYLFESTDYLNQLSVSDAKQGYRSHSHTHAFLMDCGTFG